MREINGGGEETWLLSLCRAVLNCAETLRLAAFSFCFGVGVGFFPPFASSRDSFVTTWPFSSFVASDAAKPLTVPVVGNFQRRVCEELARRGRLAAGERLGRFVHGWERVRAGSPSSLTPKKGPERRVPASSGAGAGARMRRRLFGVSGPEVCSGALSVLNATAGLNPVLIPLSRRKDASEGSAGTTQSEFWVMFRHRNSSPHPSVGF